VMAKVSSAELDVLRTRKRAAKKAYKALEVEKKKLKKCISAGKRAYRELSRQVAAAVAPEAPRRRNET